MLSRLELLPITCPGTEERLLDAACGIAAIPHVLATWGFQVTAIDSCPDAVSAAERQRPSDAELARCIRIWEPWSEDTRSLVDDPVRSLDELRGYSTPGGSVRYLHADWFDDIGEPFDLIYCRNSLRRSSKRCWIRTLTRFHELLVPGGVLVLETLNALGIRKEVGRILDRLGFRTIESGIRSNKRYVEALWPTG